MFTSTHYAGKEMRMDYRNGEPWKKVFGPVFAYLNSVSPRESTLRLWRDAKRKVLSSFSFKNKFVIILTFFSFLKT